MVQDHTRRLRRAIERHAREHPLGEDYVMTTDTDIIIALARKLEAENTRLRAENAALRAGQGHWPEGDDSPAGEQVRNREAERDELKAERDDLQRRFEFLQNDFNQFYLEHRNGTPHIITAEQVEAAARTMHNAQADTPWGESQGEREADMAVQRSAFRAAGLLIEGGE